MVQIEPLHAKYYHWAAMLRIDSHYPSFCILEVSYFDVPFSIFHLNFGFRLISKVYLTEGLGTDMWHSASSCSCLSSGLSAEKTSF